MILIFLYKFFIVQLIGQGTSQVNIHFKMWPYFPSPEYFMLGWVSYSSSQQQQKHATTGIFPLFPFVASFLACTLSLFTRIT